MNDKKLEDTFDVAKEIQEEAWERKSKPMNFQQLRERLKHIAGLCWGLSIDLQNEIEYREELEKEVKRLRAEIYLLGGTPERTGVGRRKASVAENEVMTPEEKEKYDRRREYLRKYAEKRRK